MQDLRRFSSSTWNDGNCQVYAAGLCDYSKKWYNIMRIGIDAHILGKNQGGVERYVKEIVERVPALLPEHRFFVFVNRQYGKTVRNRDNRQYVMLPVSDPIFQRSIILPLLVKRLNIDILHTQRVLPIFVNCKCLVSIHDILPLNKPENHRGLRNEIIRKLTPWSAKKALRILTVSETVKREIVSTLSVSKSKVKTVYNGIDHRKGKETGIADININSPYILFSGAVEPRKNLLCLAKGFKLVCEKYLDPLKLVIAGMDRNPEYRKELCTLIRDEAIDDKVIFTGFVSDSTLDALYKNAEIFIAPSMGEGFDLPPLEAMKNGTPVICSDIEVHRELLNDSALFFKVDSPAELAELVLLLYNQPEKKKNLIKKGIATANKFTWEETACQTAEIYKETEKIRV